VANRHIAHSHCCSAIRIAAVGHQASIAITDTSTPTSCCRPSRTTPLGQPRVLYEHTDIETRSRSVGGAGAARTLSRQGAQRRLWTPKLQSEPGARDAGTRKVAGLDPVTNDVCRHATPGPGAEVDDITTHAAATSSRCRGRRRAHRPLSEPGNNTLPNLYGRYVRYQPLPFARSTPQHLDFPARRSPGRRFTRRSSEIFLYRTAGSR